MAIGILWLNSFEFIVNKYQEYNNNNFYYYYYYCYMFSEYYHSSMPLQLKNKKVLKFANSVTTNSNKLLASYVRIQI